MAVTARACFIAVRAAAVASACSDSEVSGLLSGRGCAPMTARACAIAECRLQ